MAATVTGEVVPFAVFLFGILIGFTKIYQVLHLKVNDPEGLYE